MGLINFIKTSLVDSDLISSKDTREFLPTGSGKILLCEWGLRDIDGLRCCFDHNCTYPQLVIS